MVYWGVALGMSKAGLPKGTFGVEASADPWCALKLGWLFQACPKVRQKDQGFASSTSPWMLAAAPGLAEGSAIKGQNYKSSADLGHEHFGCITAAIANGFIFI